MTPEQLDEIEELAEGERWICDNGLCDCIEPLVKALREAWVLNPPNGYFEDIDRLTKERDEAQAEVELLRAAITRFVNQYPWQQGPEIQELKALTDPNR